MVISHVCLLFESHDIWIIETVMYASEFIMFMKRYDFAYALMFSFKRHVSSFDLDFKIWYILIAWWCLKPSLYAQTWRVNFWKSVWSSDNHQSSAKYLGQVMFPAVQSWGVLLNLDLLECTLAIHVQGDDCDLFTGWSAMSGICHLWKLLKRYSVIQDAYFVTKTLKSLL